MVADALKIADGVQQGIYALAVGVTELIAGQFYQVGAQSILVIIHLLLLLPDLLGQGIVPGVGQAHGLHHACAGQFSHISRSGTGTLHSHGGGVEQTLIQQGKFLLLCSILGDGDERQLLQHAGKGQQYSGGQHVEDGVDDGDIPRRNGVVDKGEMQDRIQAIESDQEQGHTNDIEVQMDDGCPAGHSCWHPPRRSGR